MPETAQPSEVNRYNMFKTSVSNALGQTVLFSVGAAVRHHPVHKGGLTALAGGAIVGAIVGLVGSTLGVKEKNSTFCLMVTGFILEQALLFATMPMGELAVPFEQNLSLITKIEDQLVGAAIFSAPTIFFLLLAACCACCAGEDRETRQQTFAATLRQQFSAAEMVFAIAELATPIEVQATVIDLERGPTPRITAVPVATDAVAIQSVDVYVQPSAPSIMKI